MVAGAVLFAAFWATLPFEIDVPWLPSLAVHGATIGLLSFGLAARAWTRPPGMARQLCLAGAAIAIFGLLVAYPLIAVGLLIVGVVAVTQGTRFAGIALSIGAEALLAAYIGGARYGTEGAGEPGDTVRAIFLVGVALTSIGLVTLGLHQARREPHGTIGPGEASA